MLFPRLPMGVNMADLKGGLKWFDMTGREI